MNMKHGLYLFMFLLCGTGLQAQDRVVEQPAFDAWSSTTLEIDKIALSDTATVFYIDAYFRPKYWIQVVKEIRRGLFPPDIPASAERDQDGRLH